MGKEMQSAPSGGQRTYTCNWLERNRLSQNMQRFFEINMRIWTGWNTDFKKEGIEKIYEGWKSVKGYRKATNLGVGVTDELKKMEDSLVRLYNAVKDGAERYSKQQEMAPLHFPDMKILTFEIEGKSYDQDAEIIVDDKPTYEGFGSIKEYMKKISTCFDELLALVSSSDKFGFESSDGDIVMNMKKIIESTSSKIGEKYKLFVARFDADLADDIAESSQNMRETSMDIADSLMK